MVAEMVSKRFAPWLEKALDKMEHSKKTWTAIQENQNKMKQKEKKHKQSQEKFDTIWEATIAGSLNQVTHFIEVDGFDVRKHNDQMGGKTILHLACWHGHFPIVEYILHYLEKNLGTTSRDSVINAADTAYTRSTPLIEACRNNQGFLNDRLEIIRLLTQKGADVERQDSYGDNALHWAARRSYLPIVRHVLKCTDAAVFASLQENYKRQKPVDVASRALKEKDTMARYHVFEMLEQSMKGCNMRLKIQKMKKNRALEIENVAALKQRDLLQTIQEATFLIQKAEQDYQNGHGQAEENRMKFETEAGDKAAKKALKTAQKYIESKEGKQWIKEQGQKLAEEIKSKVRSGEMEKPKDSKKAGIKKAKEKYYKDKETEAREIASRQFRATNPPLKKTDVSSLALE